MIGKVVSAALAAILFASKTPWALASCAKCKEQCLTPDSTSIIVQLLNAENLPLPPQGEAANDLNAFKYGKYCGASNFCPSFTDACNPIDQACKDHDMCYGQDDAGGDPATQCECNNALIDAVAPEIINPCPAGDLLCDSDSCPYDSTALSILCLFCIRNSEIPGCALTSTACLDTLTECLALVDGISP